MGNYKRKKKRNQSELDSEMLVSGGTGDMIDEFRRAMDDIAVQSDTSSILEKGIKKELDETLWINKTLLSFQDFCSSADHMRFPPLSERQQRVADFMFGEDPKGMFENGRNTAILAWGKGCLSFPEKSEIISQCGKRMTIKECAERNLPIMVWSRHPNTGRIVGAVSTPAIKKSQQENCFHVVTSFGHMSDASGNHKYFTVSGWKELKELSVGDWILGGMPKDPTNIYGESERLCRWIGYMIGDGNMSSGSKPSFFCSTPKPDIISDYVSIVEGFGAVARVLPHNTPISKVIKFKFGDGVKGSNLLVTHAKRLGIYGKTAKDKRIPVEIMFSSKRSRVSFLEALYATDGWISRHGSRCWEIGYIAKNRRLIEDLDFMLRGFGIVGKIKPKYATYKGERREYWQLLIIHKGEQRKFSSLFKVPGKQSAQSQMDADICSGPNHGFACPPELTTMCAPTVATMGRGTIGNALRGRAKQGQSYSYETVASVSGMDVMANEDVIWEQIVSIEPLGMHDVYTFTVPSTKNYLQGGLFHHNSGKDTISSLMILYVVYILLNLKNPQRFLGLPDNSSIDLLNVACSKEQASTVYFQIFKTSVLNWQWLRNQWDIVINGRFFSSGQEGDVDYINKVTVTNDAVLFPKNIRAFSGSAESETLEGRNIICFSGDTKVSLVDGREVEIRELVDKEEFWVYSYNGKAIVPAVGRMARKTAHMADTVYVELDNGERVRCTPNHLFMMRDGTYKQAMALSPGDRLMPLYRKYGKRELIGYELVYQPYDDKFHYTRATVPPTQEKLDKISKRLQTMRDGLGIKNHVVVSVSAAAPCDVYDITVDGYHNFALSAGVFVHNCFALDEVDAFKTKSLQRSAAKIYRVVRTSATSRFGNKFKGFVFSYPRSESGFILKLYEQSKKFLNMYSDLARTWEVKPRALFSSDTFEFEGERIPMDFYEDFRLDPLGAKAAYLCKPPKAESLFLEDSDKVDLATKGFSKPLFEFRDVTMNNMVRKIVSHTPILYDKAILHTLTLDLSVRHDATAMCLSHREGDKIFVDFITAWIPDPKNKIEVDLANVEEVLDTVRREVTVKMVGCDHWNSALLSQKLRGKGVNSETIKLEYDDFEIFKRLLYAGNIILPRHQRLLNELKNLQMVSSRKVDHPEGLHNDLAVTVIMAVKLLLRDKGSGGMTGLSTEGEYIGENLHEAANDNSIFFKITPDEGIQIDGIPL